MIIRGWRQDIVTRIRNDNQIILPDIINDKFLGKYILTGFKILWYALVYTVPLILFFAIFGIEIVEIVLDVLVLLNHELLNYLPGTANLEPRYSSLKELLQERITSKVVIEGLAITIYSFFVRPLFRVAMIRFDLDGARNTFLNRVEVKRNWVILRKNKNLVFSAFFNAIIYDLIGIFAIGGATTVTFGFGLFIFTPFVLLLFIHLPKAINYGLLVKKLEASLSIKNENPPRKLSQSNGAENYISSLILGFSKNYKDKTNLFSFLRNELYKLRKHVKTDDWVGKILALFFPPFGTFYLSGWKQHLMQKYGEMEMDVKSNSSRIKQGFKLSVAKAIYYIPFSILLGITGLESIFLVINFLRWMAEQGTGISLSALVGFILTEFTLRFFIQLVLLGIYNVTVWPLFNIITLKYLDLDNKKRSIRSSFFSISNIRKCFQIYRSNAEEILFRYFLVFGIRSYIPLILSLIIILTLGFLSPLVALASLPLRILAGSWLSGFIYGELYKVIKPDHTIETSLVRDDSN